jgi:hypothetical protein
MDENSGEEELDVKQSDKYPDNFWNRLKRQLRKPRFFLELLALIGLGFYSCETRRTNNLTQTALDNSKSQFTTEQRPYVWLTNNLGPFSVEPLNSGNTSGRLGFNFHYTNFGKSPAVNCQTQARIIFGENAEERISFRSLDPRKGAIVPPGKDEYNTAWSDNPVSQDLFAKIQTAGTVEYVIVSGYFQYSDTSGNVYSSEFCLERNPGLGLAFCKDHNSIK